MRRTFVSLALLAAAESAIAGCLPIAGTVQLSHEQQGCTVQTYYPGTTFLPNECYAVTLKLGGLLPAYGYAGVTVESMNSEVPSGGAALSPVAVQGTRNVLTARSTFTLAGTRFYAAEVIVESGGFVTEQSVITGTDGNGLLRNATGGFAILGDSTSQSVPVRGQICTP